MTGVRKEPAQVMYALKAKHIKQEKTAYGLYFLKKTYHEEYKITGWPITIEVNALLEEKTPEDLGISISKGLGEDFSNTSGTNNITYERSPDFPETSYTQDKGLTRYQNLSQDEKETVINGIISTLKNKT